MSGYSTHVNVMRKRHLSLVTPTRGTTMDEPTQSESIEETEKQRHAEVLRDEITERLMELAEIDGPEDTLRYVETIARQMRDEIAAGI